MSRSVTCLTKSILFRRIGKLACCFEGCDFRCQRNSEIAREHGRITKTMPHDSEQREDVVAAGASCPMHDCGALAIAYRSTEDVPHDDAEPWNFTCPRCGFEFAVPEGDLIFQLVPKEWLLAKVRTA